MGKPESQFPTIADLQSVLADLVAKGYGDLPVQVLVVPDSSLQSIARADGAPLGDKPALMIEFSAQEGRHPVSIMSTERLSRGGKPHVVQ